MSHTWRRTWCSIATEVRCPLCGQMPGELCVDPGTQRIREAAHLARCSKAVALSRQRRRRKPRLWPGG